MLFSNMTDQGLVLFGIGFFAVIFGLIFAHEYFMYYRKALNEDYKKSNVIEMKDYNDNGGHYDIW